MVGDDEIDNAANASSTPTTSADLAKNPISKPLVLTTLPSEPKATRAYERWLRVFNAYVSTCGHASEEQKLGVLASALDDDVYFFINSCNTLEDALQKLAELYGKTGSPLSNNYALATRIQAPNEEVSEYIAALESMSKNCSFKLEEYTEAGVREYVLLGTLIRGLRSEEIRTKILEDHDINYKTAIERAKAMAKASKESRHFKINSTACAALESSLPSSSEPIETPASSRVGSTTPQSVQSQAIAAVSKTPQFDELAKAKREAIRLGLCLNCRGDRHATRNDCPAYGLTCSRCQKQGHFAHACLSATPKIRKHTKYCTYTTPKLDSHNSKKSVVANIAINYPSCLAASTIKIKLNGQEFYSLVDTGSASNLIKKELCDRLGIPIKSTHEVVSLADLSTTTPICGTCLVNIEIGNNSYSCVEFKVMNNLCADLIIGIEMLSRHSEVKINYGGTLPSLNICALNAMKVEPPSLFSFLSPTCKPIATKSRFYSQSNREFIESEVKRLLKEGVIEPSISPWRAQIVVVNQNGKRRMVVDYSETINKYTYLDAYPLPNLDNLVNEIANYKYYSKIDLRSAYHLVPIREDERHFTAFEANGHLFQFKRISFGLTNGVSGFQRVMSDFIQSKRLQNTFAYLDDITICGKSIEEHDKNL